MFPTRLRTERAALERNFSGSARSAPESASASVSKSSVPWCSTRPRLSRCAVPETLRPSTQMSFRPESSAATPSAESARHTGRASASMLSEAVSSASVMKE